MSALERSTKPASSTWDDVRRMVDQLQVQIQLGSMEARDRWRALQPRIDEVEQAINRAGSRLDEMMTEKVEKIGAALRKVLDDISGTRGA